MPKRFSVDNPDTFGHVQLVSALSALRSVGDRVNPSDQKTAVAYCALKKAGFRANVKGLAHLEAISDQINKFVAGVRARIRRAAQLN